MLRHGYVVLNRHAATERHTDAKVSSIKDSGSISRTLPLRTKISKNPSSPQDMGDMAVSFCRNGGITNFGTIIPPSAQNIMTDVPQTVLRSFDILQNFATIKP